MVKGISRQVILVPSPDPKLFEQAIFILNDEAVKKGIAEDTLLKEAKKLMAVPEKNRYSVKMKPGAIGLLLKAENKKI